MRAVSDPEHWRIFSLIHAEKLSYQVSDLALRTLSEHSQGKQGKSLHSHRILCDQFILGLNKTPLFILLM